MTIQRTVYASPVEALIALIRRLIAYEERYQMTSGNLGVRTIPFKNGPDLVLAENSTIGASLLFHRQSTGSSFWDQESQGLTSSRRERGSGERGIKSCNNAIALER
jgi:hypothetical protein